MVNGQAKPLWRTSLFGVFVASLILMLGGSLTASWIQSGQGSVQVKEVTYLGAENAVNDAYLFIPNGVTATTPAPAIMTVHGFNNSKEYMANTALELARRGYVVLDIDMETHGHSEVTSVAGDGGIGTVDGLNYLTSLPIVDKTKVGALGMSMGGVAIDLAAKALPTTMKSMFFMDSTCALSCAMPINQAETVGTLTEFTVWQSGGNGTAPLYADILSSKLLEGWANTTSPIVSGQLYGSVADMTAREFWSHSLEHAFSTDDPEAIGDAISWFTMTLPVSTSVGSDQIWPIKDLGTGAALVGFLLFVLSLGGLLLRSRAFSGLAEATPDYKGNTGGRWWLFAAITALLGPITFFWAFSFGYTGNWFNWEGVTTGFAFWMAFLGVITMAILVAGYFLFAKKAGARLVNYGLTWEGKGLDWAKIVLSGALALAVLSVAYGILWAVDSALKVYFRFWVVTLKTSDLGHLPYFIGYSIPFALYFIATSAAMHGTLRPKNGDVTMRREMLTNIVILVVGAIGLLLWYYGQIAFMNASPLNSASLGMDVGIINFIGTLLILPAVAAVMTYFFRKTGHVYAGAFMCAFMLAWYFTACNTTYHI